MRSQSPLLLLHNVNSPQSSSKSWQNRFKNDNEGNYLVADWSMRQRVCLANKLLHATSDWLKLYRSGNKTTIINQEINDPE